MLILDDGVEVAVKDEMIDSFYKKVDHLGEKEAAGSAVVIPFLGQVIEATLQRQHLLDPQLIVARTGGRGRNARCNFAIVRFVIVCHLPWADQ